MHAHIRRLTRSYRKHPRWSSSRHSYNVTNYSILDVRGSHRYESAYLVTKYITKKKNRYGPSAPHPPPPLHLDNMYSDYKVFMIYCSR